MHDKNDSVWVLYNVVVLANVMIIMNAIIIPLHGASIDKKYVTINKPTDYERLKATQIILSV